MDGKKTYVVEHLDPECGPWSTLEYTAIAKESTDAGAAFCLSSAPSDLNIPESVKAMKGFNVDHRSVEDVYQGSKDRICLLDPAAKEELSPKDAYEFDIFVFGGILGDDPPRDRTSELRKKGFTGRRLGPLQMTTDTAVRVTRMVIQEQNPLGGIPYVDYPEIRIDEHESTEMPFRYVKGLDGKPIMPESDPHESSSIIRLSLTLPAILQPTFDLAPRMSIKDYLVIAVRLLLHSPRPETPVCRYSTYFGWQLVTLDVGGGEDLVGAAAEVVDFEDAGSATVLELEFSGNGEGGEVQEGNETGEEVIKMHLEGM
ncbi:MAG: hypothetical protein Q9209_003928 [Squamulea sp. 1 TL-2023]